MSILKLRKSLKDDEKLPFLITDLKNIKYLTGFEGSNGFLVLGKGKSYFISDSRYELYARNILKKNIEFVLQEGNLAENLRYCLEKEGSKELFVESHDISLGQFLELKKKLRGVKLSPVSENFVGNLRIVKGEEEVDTLRSAAKITDECVSHLLNFVRPGISEWDVVVEIESFYKGKGCSGCSFDPIVASGVGAAMPHYMPNGNKKLKKGECLLIDMGCIFNGYNSDLTRTFFIDRVNEELHGIYNIVKDAQARAIEAVKPGVTTGQLDRIAREVIESGGYGKFFTHSLGHGVGLDIHEEPALRSGGKLKLKKNMVITIEPGIYVSGLGGVRIEDMVLVTKGGCEVLTKSSKELIVV